MKMTITLNYFRNWFVKHKPNYFSYDGLEALYDFLIEIGEKEFDPVSIYCYYNEYKNIEEFWKEYNKEDYPNIESINNKTTLIKINDESFIIKPF